ncbi:MAG: hypothetical protein ACYSYL_02035 [Planctomycetota bacterium]
MGFFVHFGSITRPGMRARPVENPRMLLYYGIRSVQERLYEGYIGNSQEHNVAMKRVTFFLFLTALVLVPFGKAENAAGIGEDSDIKLDEPVSPEVLREFKKQIQQGYNLQYFVFDPKHPRYREKHGTSGDELMEKIAEGGFPADEKCLHVDYIYGWFWQNCKRYYVMYRLSGDTYYIEQLTKYAEGMDWILANRAHILYPKERRANLGKVTVDMVPWETAAASNFIAHVYAGQKVIQFPVSTVCLYSTANTSIQSGTNDNIKVTETSKAYAGMPL